MTPIDFQAISPLLGTAIAIGTAVVTVQKININLAKAKQEDRVQILQEVNEEVNLVKIKLEARMEAMRAELKGLETSVAKDLEYIRDHHRGQIENLGEKIEELRDELRSQHSQLLVLLSKMIESRE